MDKIMMMKTFVAVAAEGNFNKAADKLELSTQLVSKYVARLEADLNIRLLHRTTRKVNVTEAGQVYANHCHKILQDIDELEGSLSDLKQLVSGTIKLSAPMSFAIHHLTEPVANFQQQYPDINIELHLTDRKVDIYAEEVDIALRIGHLKSSSLIAKKIAPIKLGVFAAPNYLKKKGYPKTFADLRNLNYLRFTYADFKKYISDPDLNIDDFKSDFRSNNGDVIVSYAKQERGFAIQPTFLTYRAVQEGKLEQIPDLVLQPLALYAVYANREYLPSKIRCFIDFLSQYYGEIPYWDREIR
jgi:DNA-binding transcriptional LysR family regulator